MRPHVLWFDEGYEEELYKSSSALRAIAKCDLLLVIGTMFQTNLPRKLLQQAAARGVPIVDVNPNPNNDILFAPLLQLVATSEEALPKVVQGVRQMACRDYK